jgi:hypothetical protein
MSNWIGTGAPVIRVSNTDYSYPHTLNGGREERWDPEVSDIWTTLSGDRIYGDRKFRFIATYKWVNLENTQLTNLLTWYNQRQLIILRPYSDVPSFQILCRIEGIELEKGASITSQDAITVSLESVELYESIEIPDTAVFGTASPKKGVV